MESQNALNKTTQVKILKLFSRKLCEIFVTCHISSTEQVNYIVYLPQKFNTWKQACLLKDFASSFSNFSKSRSIRSRQPRPLSSTTFWSVENASLSLSAILSQSAGFSGIHGITSLARARSWKTSGHLKGCAILTKDQGKGDIQTNLLCSCLVHN